MTPQTIVELIADGLVLPIIILAGYALLLKVPKGHRFEAYARILMAGLTAYVAAKLLASIYQPSGERPFEIMGVEPGASYLNNPGFPSDHALFTAFLTLAVWFETRKKGIAIALGLMTLLVCIGRVLALVHTPLDVIGGILVACVGVVWYLQADNKNVMNVSRKKHKKLVQ
ncbi:MAG TPA: phosphatase PAP2 family protein [Candidatus Saccharimonadales bacterium]